MNKFYVFFLKVLSLRFLVLFKVKNGIKLLDLNISRLRHSANSFFHGPIPKHDLVIIDDFLPNVLSAFRAFEFSFLLNNIPKSSLYSIIANKLSPHKKVHDYYISNVDIFNGYKKEFVSRFAVQPNKVNPFYTWTKFDAKAAYIVFLTNAFYLLDYLEKNNVKFILELYPGGGFSLLKEGEEFRRLKKVLSSPSLLHVITTQKITHSFLIENELCPPEKISYMYGGIIPNTFDNVTSKRIRFKENKNTLDICFAAAKYMPKGLDKGYDIFIETAHRLLKNNTLFRFHIVGGFNEDDIPIDPAYRQYFKFYGYLKTSEFQSYFQDKDIFISPSRPFCLGEGFFDAFPTGTCADAGLNGLCLIASDPLKLNSVFGESDAIMVDNDPECFEKAVLKLLNNPQDIYAIGHSGKNALKKTFGPEQLQFRLSLLKKLLLND